MAAAAAVYPHGTGTAVIILVVSFLPTVRVRNREPVPAGTGSGFLIGGGNVFCKNVKAVYGSADGTRPVDTPVKIDQPSGGIISLTLFQHCGREERTPVPQDLPRFRGITRLKHSLPSLRIFHKVVIKIGKDGVERRVHRLIKRLIGFAVLPGAV